MIRIARRLALSVLMVPSSLVAQATVAGGGKSASVAGPDLKTEILAADSALFTAFNARNVNRFRSFFSRDLEFYQDNEGVENYTQTMKDFTQMFGQPAQLHRELVPGTLEVYPIKNYGAIEVGSHRFCHVENGKDDCGTFKFVHIWRRTKAGWKITRVVSYAH